jgi:glycosyltransferase involved in cell wall biosynthesis
MTCSPEFLGGTNLFHKNLIKYIHSKHPNNQISWIYFGEKNKRFMENNIEYIELRANNFFSASLLGKIFNLSNFFKKNYFDVINTETGLWIHLYPKIKNQRIVQTFHGTRFYFNKNHYRRLSLIKRTLLLSILPLNWLTDIPSKKTKKIICVSEKVKRQVEQLYGKKKNLIVIRTGVDLKKFKVRNKNKVKEKLGFEKKNNYGLYIGGGGYWTKGLDRAVKISEEMYKLNKHYRLIVIGPESEKVKHLLREKSVIYLKNISRKDIPYYYNLVDFFFCMSRYEGGAPTLVTSEAMASGCPVICAKSAEQEILENGKNSLILENFGKEEAKKILNLLKNEKRKKLLIRNALSTIKNLSLEKWGRKYCLELIGK